jgi:hypothetical protein
MGNNSIVKPEIKTVLLACCTCNRPKMLKDVILSANEMFIPENIKIELLIVDNDSEKSAKKVVEELRNIVKFHIHYVVEPNRGLSFARNKLLSEAIFIKPSHILLFDDDELFDKNCLYYHINLYKNDTKTLISSGPTWNKFDKEYPTYITKNLIFKQVSSKKTGDIRNHCASGNVFFPLSLIEDYGLRFSEEYVFMGGEDGDFFSKASKLGFTIVYNKEAVIYEIVSKSRANLKYILKRQYYNGYAGAFSKFKNKDFSLKKFIYVTKNLFSFLFLVILNIISILAGLTVFFNVLGMTIRNFGKIIGTLKSAPLNFYKKMDGE